MQEMKTILAVGSIAIDTLQTPNGNRKNVLGGVCSIFSLVYEDFWTKIGKNPLFYQPGGETGFLTPPQALRVGNIT